MILKRVGPMSMGKVLGATYAIMGFIFGCIFALLSLVGAGLAEGAGAMGAIFGLGAIIILPILYGLMGFIGGIIFAAIYNLVAGWVGGIELDLQ